MSVPGRLPATTPVILPLASLLAGTVALAAAATGLALDPAALAGAAASPALLALVHAVTVGYVALLFAGTLQQLLPVLLVTGLAVPRLSAVAVPSLALGAAAVVVGFALGFRPLVLAVGGSLASVALWAVAAQAIVTYARAHRASARGGAAGGGRVSRAGGAGVTKRPSPAAAGLVTATVYLALAVTLGFLLAAATRTPLLARTLGYPVQLHLALGLFGAFLLGIAAAGRKLLAMFVLSKGTPTHRLRVLTYLVHAAVASELMSAFTRLPLSRLAFAFLAVAGALQLWEVAALLHARLRKQLEPSVRRYVLAHAFLPIAGVLVVAGRPRAAGAAMLLGFVVLATSGMQVKIASFLTWQARYAGRGTASGAPLLRDMVVPVLEPLTTVGLAGGAAAATIATATHGRDWAVAAAALLVMGSGALLVQTVAILFGFRSAPLRPPARLVRRKENV